MSYEKALTSSQHAEIAHIVAKMQDLPERSSFTLSGYQKDLSRVRFLIYKWLFHNNLKSNYRISYEKPTMIRIYKQGKAAFVTGEDGNFRTLADFVCSQEMYDASTDEEAIAIIRVAAASGKLDPTLSFDAFNEWKKSQGGASSSSSSTPKKEQPTLDPASPLSKLLD